MDFFPVISRLWSNADFAIGALTVVGVVGVVQLWKLLDLKSPDDIERMCTMPVPYLRDKHTTTITIWGFQEPCQYPAEAKLGIPDSSPYVNRVECFLRLCKIDYVKKASMGGRENPRRKVPFANVKGVMVDDSHRIIETVKKVFSVTVDEKLDGSQLTTGLLVRRLLDGSLYWVLMHQVFNTNQGRKCFEGELGRVLPQGISKLVARIATHEMSESIHATGIGRYPRSEVVRRGQDDVRALSSILGEKTFLLGTAEPTSYDTDVYSWLVQLFFAEPHVGFAWVVDMKEECPNLVEYVQRTRTILFPERSS